MSEICVKCEKPYGKHASVGDYCPQEGGDGFKEQRFEAAPREPDDDFGNVLVPVSLRDYMAGQALVAFISEPVEGQQGDTAQAIALDASVAVWFAERAYQMADAMLAARGGGK